MSQKGIWTTIGIIVVVLIVAGVIYWQYQAPKEEETLDDEQSAIQDVQESLDAATKAAVDIPTVNPLDEAIPDVNPLEKTNPFRTRNPFE